MLSCQDFHLLCSFANRYDMEYMCLNQIGLKGTY